MYRICDKVSIPRRGPHCIRRTYASTLLDNHTDESLVKNQMGHTDITTTIKYYQFCVRNNSEQRETDFKMQSTIKFNERLPIRLPFIITTKRKSQKP